MVSDGLEALEAFHRESPALVLLDVMLPVLTLAGSERSVDKRSAYYYAYSKGEVFDKVLAWNSVPMTISLNPSI